MAKKRSAMARLGLWYEKANPWFRAFVSSFLVVLPFYLTAILSYFVRQGLDDKKLLGLFTLVTLGLLLALFVFRRYVEIRVEETRRISEQQRSSIGQAHNFSDELVALDSELVREGIHAYNTRHDGTDLFEATIASVKQIRLIVERLYLVLESHYAKAQDYINQINFEVTFMTKSYKDGEITVLAWRNRERRAPRSLILREGNPKIYDTTVTASIYAAARPEMALIQSTQDEKARYTETYEGQKARIKSSIVYPVLSDNNVLLGTLVVHCDEDDFFKTDDTAYWKALLEIYASRIAYQKVCLDVFHDLDLRSWITTVNSPALFDF